jgi:hypothetical protein
MPITTFPRSKYTTQLVGTHNSNTIYISDIDTTRPIVDSFICSTHKLTKDKCCNDATQISKYSMPLLIRDKNMAFFIPPPMIFGKNNHSFLLAFLKQFHTTTQLNTPTAYKQLVAKYDKFLHKSSFKGGYLAQQIGGKTSYYRLQCLGNILNNLNLNHC